MKSLNHLRPYDYIEDYEGYIYLVKGFIIKRNAYLAKLMYAPSSSGKLKCKSSYPENVKLPDMLEANNAGHMDFIVPLDKIFKAIEFHEFNLSNLNINNPLISEIGNIIRNQKGEAFLFGSRILQIDNPESDWDILIHGINNPYKLVEDIKRKMLGKVRLFNTEEIEDRAVRYNYPNGYFDKGILKQIFKDTTLYLKSKSFEIGLFFTSNLPQNLPDFEMFNIYESKTLKGEIVLNNGSSYHVPRTLELRKDNNEIVYIKTPIWELGGLEMHHGKEIILSGLHKVDEKTWWLGSHNAKVKFILN